jgi:hypothetical protein
MLPNPRQEAFAWARAGGALLDEAYEAAGFAPGNRHASRLANRPDVAARIEELLAARDDAREAHSHAVIGALLRLAEAAAAPGGAAALGEVCEGLVQARKLMEGARRARNGGP